MKVVVDTNVLVSALSSRSVYHWMVTELLNQKFDIYITDEILLEYEEVLTKKYSAKTANNFIAAITIITNSSFYPYLLPLATFARCR